MVGTWTFRSCRPRGGPCRATGRRSTDADRGRSWTRGSTRRPGGTQPPGAGHGCRPAGTAGLSLRALVSVVGSAVQAGLSLRSRAAGVDQPAGRNSPSGCGAAGFEQMACLESASGPRAAWMDQPCRRDSASRRGPGGSTSRPGGTCAPGAEVAVVDQPSRRDLCSGCGGCGGDQLDRRDLGSGRGPAGVTRWTGGTWALSARLPGWTRGACGTCAPGACAAVGDQAARRYSASGRGPAGVDQLAQRDLFYRRGGRGGGPAGPAGLGLWAPGPRVWARWPRGT